MRTAAAVILACLLQLNLSAQGQEKKESPEASVYKVDFSIRDGSEPAAKAGRRYSILIEAGGRGTLRVGNRVPYATGSFQPGQSAPGVSPLVSTQFQYLDTGVSIDCRLREVSGKIAISAEIDVTTIVEHPKGTGANPPNPTVASIKINVSALLSPAKPTLVASIDDPVTARKFDVEAGVTKLN